MSSSRRTSRARSSAPSSSSTLITDDQIKELISKLHSVLPTESLARTHNRVSAGNVLQEACNHIRSLHKEVDDLSERITELLQTTEDSNSDQAAIIRSLLM